MKRREFIEVLCTSPAAAFLHGCFRGEPPAGGSNLVDTPEKRAEYLAKMLKELCSDLGPHPVGSPGYDRAVQIVRREMKRSLPVVELDTFAFDSWRLKGEPELYVGETSVEAYPRIETAGTPSDGIRGMVRISENTKNRYEIVDSSSGDLRAFITLYDGSARPLYASPEEYRKYPTVTVGVKDVPMLEKAILNNTPVRLKACVDVVSGTPTSNVAGTLPGSSTDEILFIAHLDTVYNTPGANDNTASLIVMLMLAHAVSGTHPQKTIRFLATAAEEYGGYRGAVHYASKRKDENTLKNIKFIVNFDSGTWNPDVEIWSEDEELQTLIENIDRDLDINGTPKKVYRTGFSLDASAFVESGARAIYVESNGQDKVYLWHRPIDTPQNVQGYLVEINFLLFHEFIQRVQTM